MADYYDNWERLAGRWTLRAWEELERAPFAAFFFAYMALLATAARGFTGEREDGPLLADYFNRHAGRMAELWSRADIQIRYFRERWSDSGKAPVLEFMGAPERIQARDYPIVQRLLAPAEESTNEELAEAIAVLVFRIRNNLFHGNKDYDSKADAAVLRHCVPLILTTIAVFEGLEPVDE